MRALSAIQGMYFVLTGVWPLVSLRSFMAVTGPKVDGWLVRTVGVLVALIGATLLSGAARRAVTPEIRLLGTGSATALGAIDTIYATKGRISKIYLLDAVLEAVLVGAWVFGARGARLTR